MSYYVQVLILFLLMVIMCASTPHWRKQYPSWWRKSSRRRTLGCDGVIGSGTKLDRCGICSGTGSTCKTISGIYTKQSSKSQYNVITNFPIGVTNVNITEARNSRNYLALRYSASQKSILNGNWSLDWSGEYKAAGTSLTYTKPRGGKHGENIYMPGPLKARVQLLLLTQTKNPGIYYSYSIPTASKREEVLSRLIQQRKKTTSSKKYLALTGTAVGNLVQQRERPIYLGDALGENNRALFNYLNTLKQRTVVKSIPSARSASFPATAPLDKPQSNAIYDLIREEPEKTAEDLLSQNFLNHYTRNRKANEGDGRNTYRSGSISRLSSDSTRQIYTWKVLEESQCSEICGGGVVQRTVICVQTLSQVTVTDENCEKYRRPNESKLRCNTHSCPPDWTAGGWSRCSVTCGRGRQYRTVKCHQQIKKGKESAVSASQCSDKKKPSTVKMCQQKECFAWYTGEWSQCSVKCGVGHKTRHTECKNSQNETVEKSLCTVDKPRHKEQCYSSCERVWLYSDWIDKCSDDCSKGSITRQVHCPADKALSSLISQCGVKPLTEKQCNKGQSCSPGRWFTGDWQMCSGDCKRANQTREVLCLKKAGYWYTATYDRDCATVNKPPTEQKCRPLECDSTESRWFVTNWSQCSVTCGNGNERREVKCLGPNMEESVECVKMHKPNAVRECKQQQCLLKQAVSINSSCKDRYKSCIKVVQARLCRLPYYRQLCCASCHSKS